MQTERFKKRLEEEGVRLEREMKGVGRKNPSAPGEFEAVATEQGSEPDIVDQADTLISYETNEGILRDLEARYNSVRDALARIANGTYGICRVGGEKIETGRLEADPAAPTCKKHLSNTSIE